MEFTLEQNKDLFSELLLNLKEEKNSQDELSDSVDGLLEKQKIEDEKEVKENAVIKDDVKTTLDSKEKTRVSNIGKFFTEGSMKVINNFLKKRDKELAMRTNALEKNKKRGFFGNLLVGGAKYLGNKAKNLSWWEKLLKAAGIIALLAFSLRDKIGGFFSDLWNNVKPMFEILVDTIKGFFAGGIDLLGKIFGGVFDHEDVKNGFKTSMKALSKAINSVVRFIKKVFSGDFNFNDTAKSLVSTLVKVFSNMFIQFTLIGTVIEWIKDGLSSVFSWFNSKTKEEKAYIDRGRDVSSDMRGVSLTDNDKKIISESVLEADSKKRLDAVHFLRDSNERIREKIANLSGIENANVDAFKSINRVIDSMKEGGLYKTPDDVKRATESIRQQYANLPEDQAAIMNEYLQQLEVMSEKLSYDDYAFYLGQLQETINATADTKGGFLSSNATARKEKLAESQNQDAKHAEALFQAQVDAVLKSDKRFNSLSKEVQDLYREAVRGKTAEDIEAMLNDNETMKEYKDLERKKKAYDVLLTVFNEKVQEWANKFKDQLPTVFGQGFVDALSGKLEDVKFENKTVENRTENIQNMVVVHKFNMASIDSSMKNLAESQKGQLEEMKQQTSVMNDLKEALSNMGNNIVNVVNGNKNEGSVLPPQPLRQ